MPRTFIHTAYIRTGQAGQKGSARLHGLVDYATEGSQAAEYAEREGLEAPTWHRGYGMEMETWEAHAWIDEHYSEHTYARTFVLSPPPETEPSLWLDLDKDRWVQDVMDAMGYQDNQYIYTWHEDESHPHAHVIAFDGETLTKDDLAAGREAGDELSQHLAQQVAEDKALGESLLGEFLGETASEELDA